MRCAGVAWETQYIRSFENSRRTDESERGY